MPQSLLKSAFSHAYSLPLCELCGVCCVVCVCVVRVVCVCVSVYVLCVVRVVCCVLCVLGVGCYMLYVRESAQSWVMHAYMIRI